jgi:hypothetical protein
MGGTSSVSRVGISDRLSKGSLYIAKSLFSFRDTQRLTTFLIYFGYEIIAVIHYIYTHIFVQGSS